MITSSSTISTDHLFNFCLHLADNALIMGHRLSEWTGHGPMLEQDIALSNIALDLIGQSRNFYQYAATVKNSSGYSDEFNSSAPALKYECKIPVTEDSLAYLRDAKDFKNILLAELPNGDWAITILKLFFFSAYQYFFYQKLINSSDKQLSAIAEKSLKEVIYHLRWSSEWVIRLGDGTEESSMRMQKAFNELQRYTTEMFVASEYEIECTKNKVGYNVELLKNEWDRKVNDIFSEASLPYFFESTFYGNCPGKRGMHTEYLKNILAEMQYLQRTYPDCEW